MSEQSNMSEAAASIGGHDEQALLEPVNTRVSTKTAAEDQVANVVTGIIALKQWQFYAGGEEVSGDKVAGPMHMLPALLWQVEKMHRVAYGGLSTGIRYQQSDVNVMGAVAVIPEGKARSPLLLFAQEALQRAHENYPLMAGASIDHMVQEFIDDREAGLIPWIGPVPTQQAGSRSAAF